jgi:sulfotransferase
LKKLFLLCGLPRSGGTWLANILNQNPSIYVTPSSPFVEMLYRHWEIWHDPVMDETMAGDKIRAIKHSYLKKLTELFYSELTPKPIVFDNRNAWQTIPNIEMYENVYGKLPKIICPVRNVEEIAASFISLCRKNGKEWKTHDTCDVFWYSINSLIATHKSKYRECLLLVEYKDLTDNPDDTLTKIYEFIDEPNYQHDFDNILVDETYKKVEKILGLEGLHKIEQGIVRSKTNPREFLNDEEISFYQEQTFWN